MQDKKDSSEQEHLRILDRSIRVLGIDDLFKGSLSAVQVRIAQILEGGVRASPPGIILVSIHPGWEARVLFGWRSAARPLP